MQIRKNKTSFYMNAKRSSSPIVFKGYTVLEVPI